MKKIRKILSKWYIHYPIVYCLGLTSATYFSWHIGILILFAVVLPLALWADEEEA